MAVHPSFYVPGNRTKGVAGKGFPRISAEEIEKPEGVSKRSPVGRAVRFPVAVCMSNLYFVFCSLGMEYSYTEFNSPKYKLHTQITRL